MSFVPLDSGPIYAETLFYQQGPIIEPWNLVSNLFFIFIVLFWLPKLRRDRLPSSFIYCLLILFVGWLGGSLYHGLRNFELWYWMDFIPIYLLTFLVSIWFWLQIQKIKTGFVLFLVFFLPSIWQLSHNFNSPLVINIGYLGLMASITVPVFLHAERHQFKNFFWMSVALVCFACALFFRQYDLELSLVIRRGTHFLWHTFGAASIHFLIIYVSSLRRDKII